MFSPIQISMFGMLLCADGVCLLKNQYIVSESQYPEFKCTFLHGRIRVMNDRSSVYRRI